MRKLASIQTVREIRAIKDADAIEAIKIQGWWLVAKKDEFKVGDKAVYCEIDSVLPEKPEFEFLRSKKFKIKTIRLKGQLSQGIAFRVQDVLPTDRWDMPVGSDVTAVIGVRHADDIKAEQQAAKRTGLARFKPVHRAGISFPSLVHKTDEERIQNLQPLLDKYTGQDFYVTEKLDGSSFTAFVLNGEFGVCSRNWRLARPGDDWWSKLCLKFKLAQKVKWVEYRFAGLLNKYAFDFVRWSRQKVFSPILDLVNIDAGVDDKYWDLALDLDIEPKLRKLNKNIAIQGEMCGPAIQANSYGLTKKDLYVFNIFDIDTQEYWDLESTHKFCLDNNLKMVPVIWERLTLNHTIDQLLNLADGMSTLKPSVRREGLVFRLIKPTIDTSLAGLNHGFVSFKAISNKWLEKHDK